MAAIKINYDGLSTQISSLTTIISSYETLTTRMTTLIQKINDGWEGEASQAYAEMMQKYLSQTQTMQEIISSFKDYADAAKTDFETVDEQCAAMIRNAF